MQKLGAYMRFQIWTGRLYMHAYDYIVCTYFISFNCINVITYLSLAC